MQFYLTYTDSGEPVHLFIPDQDQNGTPLPPTYWDSQQVRQFIVHLRFREIGYLFVDTKTDTHYIYTHRYKVRERLYKNSIERYLEKNKERLVPAIVSPNQPA